MLQLKPGKDGEVTNPQVTYVQQLITPYYLQSGMGSMQAISKTSKDPARCMMFLNMFYGSDHAMENLFAFGIEGRDYTLTSDGQAEIAANAPWNPNMQWGFGNQLNQYTNTQQSPDVYKQMAGVNATAKRMYCSGFLLDQSSITAQFAAVTNACKPLNDPLTVGAVDPATQVPKLKAAANAAGLAAVQAEVQKQMDAHVAANPLS